MTGLYGPLDSNTDSRSTTTLTIIGDGRTLETIEIRQSDPVRQFTVSVSGVSQLEFRFSGAGHTQGYGVASVILQ
jgi:hypothetical protein